MEKEVIVCVGPGGVGKTTVSAMLGLAAAANGKRTLVMTIDPARRLAQAMGLNETGYLEHEITADKLEAVGVPISGSLSVIMPDVKRTFDGLIESPLLGTTIVGGVNVLATYVALLLMENNNRRTLILWSAAGMLISSIALVLCLLGLFSKMASLFFVITYVSFFEIGLGPIPWLIVAEMFEAKVLQVISNCFGQRCH